MKIYYIMDMKFQWVPGFILMEALKRSGHEITTYNIRNANAINFMQLKKPIPITIPDGFDLTFVIQNHFNCEITNAKDNFIVYYHTEFTWYPSCENPDFIMQCFPEMTSIFARFFPRHLAYSKYQMDFGYCHIKEMFPKKIDKTPNKIYWMGHTFAQDDSECYIRQVYSKRMEVLGELYHMGFVSPQIPIYGQEFLLKITKWEAGVVVDGFNSYYSPRPVEYSMAGCIPIIYIQDMFHKQYYEDRGFNDGNCFMFEKPIEIKKFIEYNQGYKEFMSKNAKDHAIHEFDWSVKIPVLMRLINTMREGFGK